MSGHLEKQSESEITMALSKALIFQDEADASLIIVERNPFILLYENVFFLFFNFLNYIYLFI